FMEALDVDEVIAQLLSSEGFSSVDEVAFVEQDEVASIEGFDDETAVEIQTRAREYLERKEAELDAKRRELGVADELSEIPGLTTAMLVVLGESGIKTVEDFAECATDDLLGWNERVDGESVHQDGFLESFDMSRDEVEGMIMSARVKAGWLTEEDLQAMNEEAAADETEADGDGEAESAPTPPEDAGQQASA
ncbi:MAG: helix-hairpin-helix domain-containing protein, partial [Methyloligellaceae bacterium]